MVRLLELKNNLGEGLGSFFYLFLAFDIFSYFFLFALFLTEFFPVALCFAVGLSLKMMAVNHFQAGVRVIFSISTSLCGSHMKSLLNCGSSFLLFRKAGTIKIIGQLRPDAEQNKLKPNI